MERFSITHRLGDGEWDPPLGALEALYDELREHPEDEEHGDVSVGHLESEESLSAYRSGLLVRESMATNETRHMANVPKSKVLDLWRALAQGDIATLDREPWKPGHPIAQ